MNVTVTLSDDAQPFEGDRPLILRSLPAGAQIRHCLVKITPISSHTEMVSVSGSQPHEWGITNVNNVVDFHARRIVSEVTINGDTDVDALVQIDIGGTWISLNNDGTMSIPDDGKDLEFPVSSAGVVNLHQVVTSRIQILQPNDNPPPENVAVAITNVTLQSTPLNVTLRIGDQGPVWFQAGELREPVQSADFTEFLQAYLLEAEVKNGYYIVPFTLHSDTIARLGVVLDIEYVRQESVLPESIREVVLPFSYEPLPPTGDELLTLTLPPDAVVRPGETQVHAAGTFDPSRIAYDPAAADPVAGTPFIFPKDKYPAIVPISAECAQSQPITVPKDLAATAIDLYIEPTTPTAALSLTILEDADGKPFGNPLLSQPARIQLDREVNAKLGWVSVPLPSEFQFKKLGRNGKPQRYWIVLTSVEGDISWAVRPLDGNGVGLQCSQDNGLSWQTTRIGRLPGTVFYGYFRLRYTPTQYQVPLQVLVGEGEAARPVSLERFKPLKRVDFTIDLPEFAEAINQYTKSAAPPVCPEGNHLANSDFESWIDLPDESQIPESWEPFNLNTYEGYDYTIMGFFADLENSSNTENGTLSQVTPVHGDCIYELAWEARSLTQHATEDVQLRIEVFWLTNDCSNPHTDLVEWYYTPGRSGYVDFELSRVHLKAPMGATQAEVRLLIRPDLRFHVKQVSLTANPGASLNWDFRERSEDNEIAHWILAPEEAVTDLSIDTKADPIIIANTHLEQTITLIQKVSAPAEHFFLLQFNGQVEEPTGEAFPQLELHWQDESNNVVGEPIIQSLTPASEDYLLEGISPKGAAQAELRLVFPPEAIINLEHILLHFTEPVSVPLSFLTQSPGELAVSDLRVAYDRIKPAPPPVPDTGLCLPTPPGQKPGEAKDDSCYCSHCQGQREMVAVMEGITAAGRPVRTGICSDCGAPLVMHGGPHVENAPLLSLLSRRETTTFINPEAVLSREALSEAAVTGNALADISGIADARAERLVEAGIDSLESLATTSPLTIAALLPGVSLEMAADFVNESKALSKGSVKRTPPVSCIMPTFNRRPFVSQAIGYFLDQDYPNRELIILDDGNDPVGDLVPEDERVRYVRLSRRISIGAKKNLGCEQARGEIIVHWDDDDWIANWRLTYQVGNLLKLNADVCGLNRLFHYDAVTRQAWLYVYPKDEKPWLDDGTLCYKKSFWHGNPFLDVTTGAGDHFLRSKQPKQLLALPDNKFYVGIIHPGNSRPIRPRPPRWHTDSVENIKTLMGPDWPFYERLLVVA